MAFLGVLMLLNLLGEFQRATGMTDYRQPATLRVSRKARCGAILGRAGHRTALHLSSTWGAREANGPALEPGFPALSMPAVAPPRRIRRRLYYGKEEE